MLNCNPETVSTDYDTSDRLFFEPLFPEDVLAVCRRLQERATDGRGSLVGVVVALGGQTPLKLARTLERAGIPVLGTSPDSIDLAEDRERFHELCRRLGIAQPPGGTATTKEQARGIAAGLGFPVLVRPSYVLGGRAMQIVYDVESLDAAMDELAAAGSLGREGGLSAERPVLVDRFLEDAVEIDVDAIRDATGDSIVGGVMEHIEEAGVHSGDSACAIPPQTPERGDGRSHRDADPRPGRRPRRPWPPQRAVRGEGRRAVRDRGQPPGQPHGAVREQGHRRAAGQGRVPGHGRRHPRRPAGRRPAAPTGRRRPHRGEGGGAPVQPLPRRRHRARPGDAQHRRGHGHRPHRSGWRSPRARPRPATASPARARSSSRWPTATSPPAWSPPGASPSSGTRWWPPPGPPPRSRPRA